MLAPVDSRSEARSRRPYGWEGASQRPTDRTPNLTSLIQMGARPYAPQIGRFLAVDPVEGGATTNPYGYVNDPYNSKDLSGRCVICPSGGSGSFGQGFESTAVSRSVVGAVVGNDLFKIAVVIVAVSACPVTGGVTCAILVGAGAGASVAAADKAVNGSDDSWARTIGGGALSGAVWGGGGALAKYAVTGREIVPSRNVRIAPGGNRGSGRTRLPHYHRRGSTDPRTGNVQAGQSIKRHRPWDTRASDTSFWSRF
jgi:RHS repeat-associated protein